MHLTNYAINKRNEECFEAPTGGGLVEGGEGEVVVVGGHSDGDTGSKRSISSVRYACTNPDAVNKNDTLNLKP
jgi:hypothetical protein